MNISNKVSFWRMLCQGLAECFDRVKSGALQGCILSKILFLVVIDWVMRETTSDSPRGIQWNMFSHLEDLIFADDMAVMPATLNHLQENCHWLNNFAKQTGLHINLRKT